jgi:hypothetical protein
MYSVMSASTDRPELLPLVFAAVDHAIESVAHSGGPLIAFALVAEGDQVTLHRFVDETLEGGVERAREFLREADANVTFVALAYDGYLTCDGVRTDAIYVAAQEAGKHNSDLFAQPYAMTDDGLAEIGNVKHVEINEPTLLGVAAEPAKAGKKVFGRFRLAR